MGGDRRIAPVVPVSRSPRPPRGPGPGGSTPDPDTQGHAGAPTGMTEIPRRTGSRFRTPSSTTRSTRRVHAACACVPFGGSGDAERSAGDGWGAALIVESLTPGFAFASWEVRAPGRPAHETTYPAPRPAGPDQRMPIGVLPFVVESEESQ